MGTAIHNSIPTICRSLQLLNRLRQLRVSSGGVDYLGNNWNIKHNCKFHKWYFLGDKRKRLVLHFLSTMMTTGAESCRKEALHNLPWRGEKWAQLQRQHRGTFSDGVSALMAFPSTHISSWTELSTSCQRTLDYSTSVQLKIISSSLCSPTMSRKLYLQCLVILVGTEWQAASPAGCLGQELLPGFSYVLHSAVLQSYHNLSPLYLVHACIHFNSSHSSLRSMLVFGDLLSF